jgi:membrane dipeptidase
MQDLNRRRLLQLGVAYGLSAMSSSRLLAAGAAADFYKRSMIVDGMGFPGSPTSQDGAPLTAAELGDVRASGLTACHVTIGSVGTMPPLDAFEKVIRSADGWGREIESNADVFQSVRTLPDIQAAKDAGRTGLIFGLQDGVSFEDDPSRLTALHRVGVRVIQPTYNRHNLLGDGCMEPADAGLSRAGIDAIRQMCDLGISVDLSHCGRKTAADAIAAATRPVSFTHTGCHALAEHPRHRTDEEMRAVAESGGVIGIFIMPYLSKGAQPTAADVVRHIEHALQVAGENHVSVGTDGNVSPTALTDEFKTKFRESNADRKRLGIAAPFETEEGYLFANDLNTSRRFETLAGLLLDRGHGEGRVAKILGANLVRVFSETWNA